jgi:prepilin-type N-terminal cleavage/methylation domain-containing protein
MWNVWNEMEPESRRQKNRIRGFTLIELMVVVSIVGLLSSIAIPSFQTYAKRSKRSEAFINLAGIFKSQKAFHAENNQYGTTFGNIGFEISGANEVDPTTIQSQYYTYTMEVFAVESAQNANYSAVATADLDPGDAMLDIIMIESNVIIKE